MAHIHLHSTRGGGGQLCDPRSVKGPWGMATSSLDAAKGALCRGPTQLTQTIWEHHIVFPLEDQKTVSFLVTAITTTFGTLFCAVLVYLTQTLATQHNLETNRTLTAIHDTSVAWTGIGSAALSLWSQKTVPASVIGVLTVFLYLGNITALNISTPALLSLQAFNLSRETIVSTDGLPNSNFNHIDEMSMSVMQGYASITLGSLQYIDSPYVKTTGLEAGTLYDVPEGGVGSGNVTVKATGFNVTCGAAPGGRNTHHKFSEVPYGPRDRSTWTIEFPDIPRPFTVFSAQAGGISFAGSSRDYMYLYTTVSILDSHNNSIAPWVHLKHPMYSLVSSLGFFRCSLSLVAQNATIAAQFGDILTLEPTIHKTSASWDFEGGAVSTGNALIEKWGAWLECAPSSPFWRDFFEPHPKAPLSVADL
ncbi:hypothetical protein B0H13DRAFT_2355281 [Mycena leptocephala]|nr:hypothetical protein B0H13DRAFT_2355281 [Mycena leptocephala]